MLRVAVAKDAWMYPPSRSGAQSPWIDAVAPQWPPGVHTLVIIYASVASCFGELSRARIDGMTNEARGTASDPREGDLDDPGGPRRRPPCRGRLNCEIRQTAVAEPSAR